MQGKDAMDLAAASTGLAAYLQFLPEVAAAFTVVWGLIRIYEWARVRILGKPKDFDL